MKQKVIAAGMLAVLLIFSSLLTVGCGSNSSKKSGNIIPPKQGTVDAVLQQQKAVEDAKSQTTSGTNSAPTDRSAKTDGESPVQTAGTGAPLSAKKMKELEDITPRHDVYDVKPVYTNVDYDFSKMNKNMMYTQIYNMLKTPDQYKGKIVRMQGTFGHYYDEKTGKHYYGCVVVDAAACCSTGMEFSRKGTHEYPANYPKIDDPIIVTGKFTSYKEGKEIFCELAEAELEKM